MPMRCSSAGDDRADAGIADQVPADEVRVAAVERIAERALNRVRAHEREERRRFDGMEDRVLVGGRERRERHASGIHCRLVDRGESGSIRLTRRREESGERAVDVVRGPRFFRSRAVLVSGDQPGADGLEDVGLRRGERFEGFARDRHGRWRLCGGGNGSARDRRRDDHRGAGDARALQQLAARQPSVRLRHVWTCRV